MVIGAFGKGFPEDIFERVFDCKLIASIIHWSVVVGHKYDYGNYRAAAPRLNFLEGLHVCPYTLRYLHSHC